MIREILEMDKWRGPSCEKCVSFRFRLEAGYDFQAVARDASADSAAFDEHYEDIGNFARRLPANNNLQVLRL